jgi:hypothetical protein
MNPNVIEIPKLVDAWAKVIRTADMEVVDVALPLQSMPKALLSEFGARHWY